MKNDGRFGTHNGSLDGCMDTGNCIVQCVVAVFECFGLVIGGSTRKRMVLHCPLYVLVCAFNCVVGQRPS
jgi:hypothetical protein